jgi:hypothetical protein
LKQTYTQQHFLLLALITFEFLSVEIWVRRFATEIHENDIQQAGEQRPIIISDLLTSIYATIADWGEVMHRRYTEVSSNNFVQRFTEIET